MTQDELDKREQVIDEAFGKLVTERRELLKYTITQLSRFTSITIDRIMELESGMPEVGVRSWEIDRLSKILGLPRSLLIEFATGAKHGNEKKSQEQSKAEETEVMNSFH